MLSKISPPILLFYLSFVVNLSLLELWISVLTALVRPVAGEDLQAPRGQNLPKTHRAQNHFVL